MITKAADGLEIHNQLFLPKDLKPGERRPAIVFVHGGPVRQMMPGYHYMQFYHWAYGINQWLANQGYVVMSINYRSGIGYGRSFRTAPNTGGAGNAEYQDVVAGGKYLQTRPDVDPNRVGIWGLSYGGVLTSQALARNSDIFKAGVDLAGVHLWGSSLDPEAVVVQVVDDSARSTAGNRRSCSFRATTTGTWRSSRRPASCSCCAQRDVYYELIVFPDDMHESHAAQPLDVHARADGDVPEEVSRREPAPPRRYLTTGATQCSDREHDLADVAAALDEAVRVGDVVERERAGDDRREASGGELADEQVDERRRAGGRSSHRWPRCRPNTPRLRLIIDIGSKRGVADHACRRRHQLRRSPGAAAERPKITSRPSGASIR